MVSRNLLCLTILALGFALACGARVNNPLVKPAEVEIVRRTEKALSPDATSANLGVLQDILEFLKQLAEKAPVCIKKIIGNCPFNKEFIQCAIEYLLDNQAECFESNVKSTIFHKFPRSKASLIH